MRRIALWSLIAVLPCVLPMHCARADDVLYRCESDAGISIQGTPCPKGVAQRKIAVDRPVSAAPAPAPTPGPQAPATPAATKPVVPLAPSSAMHGPNEPYPLWVCMRADGSTFDSRTGIAGKQWVANPDQPEADVDANTPPKITLPPKGQLIVRPIDEAKTVDDAHVADVAPPPLGAAPGKWVADQCAQLDPQQACERFATRRDALRKEIYAAKPSERGTYAPEEQDLTAMLFSACGGR